MKDDFYARGERQGGKVVAEYIYSDEHGENYLRVAQTKNNSLSFIGSRATSFWERRTIGNLASPKVQKSPTCCRTS
jgi:hypothetical protein